MNPSAIFENRRYLVPPSRRNMMWQLVWKEARQLVPLIAMLVLISVGLNCLSFMIRPSESSSSLRMVAFLGLPTLFAAGVGAMLVGQERETRTLQWMASLPVPGSLQAWIKLLVGALGLITMWGISFSLFAVSAYAVQGNFNMNGSGTDLPFYLLHSVFLLVAGLACAWYFHNTLVGLLGLVAVTVLITLVDSWIADVFGSASDGIRLTVQAAFCALALVAMQVTSYRAYRPQRVVRSRSQANETMGYFDQSFGYAKILTPRYALLWQFSKQNRWILLAITALFALGGILLGYNSFFDYGIRDGQDTNLVVFGCFLIACCGLGVIVFQGDSLHQRIRFLADRGVSPGMIWFSRHAIPFSLLMAFTIIVAAIGIYSMVGTHDSSQDRRVMQLALLGVAAYAWVIYAVSQWASQALRSAIVSTIVCPIVAVVPFAYGAFVVSECETPIVLLLVSCVIPFIATYRTTQQWMELRVSKKFWIEHGIWLTMATVIPLLPFFYSYLTYPTIASAQRAKLQADAELFRKSYSASNRIDPWVDPKNFSPDAGGDMMGAGGAMMAAEDGEMGMLEAGTDDAESVADASVPIVDAKPASAWDPPSGFASNVLGYSNTTSGLNRLPIAERMAKRVEHVETQMASFFPGTSIEESQETLQLYNDTTLLRMKLQGPKKTEADQDLYQRAMKNMLAICKGIRSTPSLIGQRTADRYDAWLFNELNQKEANDFLGEELALEIYGYLRDKRARQDIRYQAVVLDWFQAKNSNSQVGQIGRFDLAKPFTSARWKTDRAIDQVAWNLTQCLFTHFGKQDAIRREVGRFFMNGNSRDSIRSPCGSWFGKWETQIDALKLSKESVQ
jgi:ABC-type transport system involved in multi-copper enzyme maturation permease subunit